MAYKIKFKSFEAELITNPESYIKIKKKYIAEGIQVKSGIAYRIFRNPITKNLVCFKGGY